MLRTASCMAFMREHFEVDTYDACKLHKLVKEGSDRTQESNEHISRFEPYNIMDCFNQMKSHGKDMSISIILQTNQFDDDVNHIILLASNLCSELVFIDTSKEFVYAATVESFKALGYKGVASATEIHWRLGAGGKKKAKYMSYYDLLPHMRDRSNDDTKPGPSSGVNSVVFSKTNADVTIQDQSKPGPSSVVDQPKADSKVTTSRTLKAGTKVTTSRTLRSGTKAVRLPSRVIRKNKRKIGSTYKKGGAKEATDPGSDEQEVGGANMDVGDSGGEEANFDSSGM